MTSLKYKDLYTTGLMFRTDAPGQLTTSFGPEDAPATPLRLEDVLSSPPDTAATTVISATSYKKWATWFENVDSGAFCTSLRTRLGVSYAKWAISWPGSYQRGSGFQKSFEFLLEKLVKETPKLIGSLARSEGVDMSKPQLHDLQEEFKAVFDFRTHNRIIDARVLEFVFDIFLSFAST